MNDKKDRGSVHWSFWIIGGVALVFNLMGCVNFIVQMDPQSLATMPEIYREMIETRPTWGTVAFGVAVFGGALGCVLLLLRRRWCLYVFIAALVGTVVSQLPFVAQTIVPPEAWFGWLSQFVIGVVLVWYAKWTSGRGWIS